MYSIQHHYQSIREPQIQGVARPGHLGYSEHSLQDAHVNIMLLITPSRRIPDGVSVSKPRKESLRHRCQPSRDTIVIQD